MIQNGQMGKKTGQGFYRLLQWLQAGCKSQDRRIRKY